MRLNTSTAWALSVVVEFRDAHRLRIADAELSPRLGTGIDTKTIELKGASQRLAAVA